MSLNIDKLHSPSVGRRSGKTTKLLAYALGELMLQTKEDQIVLVVTYNYQHQGIVARQLLDLARDMGVEWDRSTEYNKHVEMYFKGAKGCIMLKWFGEREDIKSAMRGYDYVTYDDREFGY